jgi:hypothetical protein
VLARFRPNTHGLLLVQRDRFHTQLLDQLALFLNQHSPIWPGSPSAQGMAGLIQMITHPHRLLFPAARTRTLGMPQPLVLLERVFKFGMSILLLVRHLLEQRWAVLEARGNLTDRSDYSLDFIYELGTNTFSMNTVRTLFTELS